MKINKEGLELIKSFEGLRLNAYKPIASEKYYTIGYGHYGSDVKAGQTISKAEAEALLLKDLEKFEGYVNDIVEKHYHDMNLNQFSALVSFTYNCGKGNLTKLTNSCKRNYDQIATGMLLYNKAGGNVLQGLVRRREAEKNLFTKNVVYIIPLPTLKRGVRGLQVNYLQSCLCALGYDIFIDGIFGGLTENALKDFQKNNKLIPDGIYGKLTMSALQSKVR